MNDEEILKLLKPKIANKGFSLKTIKGLASQVAKNLEEDADEDAVNAAIDAVMPYADLMQAENTRYANEIKKKAASTPQPGSGNEPTTPPADDKPDDSDDPIAKLTQLVTSLAGSVNELKEGKKVETLQSKWQEAAKAKGIKNAKLIEKWMPKDEDEFDSALEDLAEFNTTALKEEANEQSTGKPPVSNGKPADSKQSLAALDAYLERTKPQEAKI